MATHAPGIFNENLNNSIKNSKILVVGAGGIGCELLKNLVLIGFEDIEVVSGLYCWLFVATDWASFPVCQKLKFLILRHLKVAPY